MTAKILAVLLLFALPIQAKTRIEAAYAAGELDLETALIYQVLSVRAPDQLPAVYRESGGLAVCGTPHPSPSHERGSKPKRRLPGAPWANWHSAGRTSNTISSRHRGAFASTTIPRGATRFRLRTTTPTASRTTSTSLWPSSTAFGCLKSINSATIRPLRTRLGRRRRIRRVRIELDGGYYGYAYPENNSAATRTATSKSTTTLQTQATSRPAA